MLLSHASPPPPPPPPTRTHVSLKAARGPVWLVESVGCHYVIAVQLIASKGDSYRFCPIKNKIKNKKNCLYLTIQVVKRRRTRCSRECIDFCTFQKPLKGQRSTRSKAAATVEPNGAQQVIYGCFQHRAVTLMRNGLQLIISSGTRPSSASAAAAAAESRGDTGATKTGGIFE